MKSIISNDRECVVCGTTRGLHKHHVFYGSANRKKSEQYGCWVFLCGKHHNLSNEGVHYDKTLDRKLKVCCQEVWEQTYGDREQFIKEFGRSYI